MSTEQLERARTRWAGRTVVVTGAAGGLGSAFSRTLAGLGADVVLSDVDDTALEAVADGVGTAIVADVREHDAVQALADQVHRDHGDVALLINNAGIEHVAQLWETPPEAWHRVVDINLNGVYHGVRAFVPRMLEAGGDAVVFNIASVAALTTGGRNAVYQVTKHGVLAMSESLADGLAAVGSGVQVSVALPGPVNTRIYADAEGEGEATEHLGVLRSLLADQGMPPEEAATLMLEQVAAGAFAVSPHPEWVERMAKQRADRLLGLLGP
jgi:NAD(P)-dependent dehydrogenase (short-subunit alcohol dehydrogenase family)